VGLTVRAVESYPPHPQTLSIRSSTLFPALMTRAARKTEVRRVIVR
jgi:hypothetical protein